jgi:ATP-binding cassette, subfamily B, multidrug efflux pump
MLQEFFEKYVLLRDADGKNPLPPKMSVVGALRDLHAQDKWRWNLLIFFTTFDAILEPIAMTLFGLYISGVVAGTTELSFSDPDIFLLVPLLMVLFVIPIGDIGYEATSNLLISSRVVQKGRFRAMRKMMDQSMSYFHNELAGRVSAKVFEYGRSCYDLLLALITQTWFCVAFFISTLTLAMGTHIVLGLMLLAWGSVIGGLIAIFTPRISKKSEELSETYSQVLGRCVDIFNNITLFKLFSQKQREDRQVLDLFNQHVTKIFRKQIVTTTANSICHVMNGIFMFSIILTMFYLWSIKEVNPGAVAALIPLLFRIRIQSHWILNQANAMSESYGTIYNAIETICQPVTLTDAPDAYAMPRATGAISFRNLSFTYPSGQCVFENLNLHIPAGQKVGLVGPSGAGKTTLVHLLLRFYDPQSGTINIDGHNIAKVTQDSLRANIGLVTQEPALLHRSILDNLRYGIPHATREDVEQAARQAAAHDFILTLKDHENRLDYDAFAGERGVKLSGGQRQRLAIARLILKNAPIMVLDEATSALDSEVEHIIQSQIYPLMKGRSVIAIAHRLSTITQMDRLIVMEKGCIIEDGSHDELLDKNGLYARLWTRQSKGFLPSS